MKAWALPAMLVASMIVPVAASGAAADAQASVILTAISPGSYSAVVNNTGTTVVTSFTILPGPGLTITGVTTASFTTTPGGAAGTCSLSGGTIVCNGPMNPPPCACNPGDSVEIYFSGTGSLAGTKVNFGGVLFSGLVTDAAAATTTTAVRTPGTPQTHVASTARVTGFTPARAKPGAKVTITGTHLSKPVWVEFGGVKAAFKAVSSTRIAATVPAKARPGKITVLTPAGEATSSKLFAPV
jgi:IPT/TIG domain